jgi:hypothetical protein
MGTGRGQTKKKVVKPKAPARATASKRKPARSPARDAAPVKRRAPASPKPPARRTTSSPSRGVALGGAESSAAVSSDARGRYVYCIIRSTDRLRFGALGLGDEPAQVYTVNHRDLCAVVSDTPMGIHDPTRENVLAHQRVNETVMREHTVIPMSFGTVFKTNDDIVELLRSAYDAFSDVLTKMKDKVEYGLKVLWDRDQIMQEIEDEDEDVRRLKNEIMSQKGSTYFARMQYGRLMDAALQARSERYTGEIVSALRDVSVASRSNKPIGDMMIMNFAFLVERNKEAAFDAKVKAIGGRHDELTFKYTGPWPPYNFVNIRLKLERAK